MKLTIVTDTYAPQINGVARTLERLVRGLRENGNQVDVIRPTKINAEEEGLGVRSFQLPGYDGIHVGYSTIAKLQARWKKDRPDIIYVATQWALGSSAISAARALQIPIVSGFHTNFEQYLSYYHLSGLEPFARAYLRYINSRVQKTYARSIDSRDALLAEGFESVDLLPHAVDTRLFSPEKRSLELRKEWGVDENAIVGIYVGRIAAEKNLSLLVKAYQRIKELHPNFQAVWVGDGPKRAELENEHKDFIFAGPRFDEDLAQHYASADVFLFPSTTETLGNVVPEAMASGLMTVAYDYAAARQHIHHGVNGFKAAFNQEDEFLACCVHAVDQRHWPEVRKNAREAMLGVSWERVVNDFETSLLQVVEYESAKSRNTIPFQYS